MNSPVKNNGAHKAYHHRFLAYGEKVSQLTKTVNRLSRMRLATVLIFGVAVLVFWRFNAMPGLMGALIVGGVLLVILVSRHHRNQSALEQAKRLVTINDRAKARLDGRWQQFTDTGAEFIDDDHPYASDLDIFGKGSLFQWLNTTGTHIGRQKLAASLSNVHFSTAEATNQKAAISTLAPLVDWRQHFQSEALEAGIYQKSPQSIIDWMEKDDFLFASRVSGYLIHILPFFFFLAGLLFFFITGKYLLFLPWIPVNLIILLVCHIRAGEILNQFDRHEDALAVYGKLLHHIEQCPSEDLSLRSIMEKLKGSGGITATGAVSSLVTLTSFGQVRYNHLLSAGLNLLFLWDLQATVLLERWKHRHGSFVGAWFEAIGQVEMLSSLSTIRYDHPDWTYPELRKAHCFKAEMLGHPLIDRHKRVCNDVDLEELGSVLIITGSNMSGKTTLLRTIGVNLVLAFAGAPVCATYLRCSPEQLLTSMRISDDLQSGISTFYAELLRIRFILEAVAKKSSIVLIDEIFRGTNTYDRYAAAVKVLENLSAQEAMTVISTHDLDLADLETEKAKQVFRNYHFEDDYQDKAIHFDYRLRHGRATTSNAMHLLELVGILSTKKEKNETND